MSCSLQVCVSFFDCKNWSRWDSPFLKRKSGWDGIYLLLLLHCCPKRLLAQTVLTQFSVKCTNANSARQLLSPSTISHLSFHHYSDENLSILTGEDFVICSLPWLAFCYNFSGVSALLLGSRESSRSNRVHWDPWSNKNSSLFFFTLFDLPLSHEHEAINI